MAKRVTNTVVSEEQHTSSDAVMLQQEKEDRDGKIKTTLIASSQEELSKSISSTPIDAVELDKKVEDTNNSSNKIFAGEASKSLNFQDAEEVVVPLGNSTSGSMKVDKDN